MGGEEKGKTNSRRDGREMERDNGFACEMDGLLLLLEDLLGVFGVVKKT